jgi:hypothetical protein
MAAGAGLAVRNGRVGLGSGGFPVRADSPVIPAQAGIQCFSQDELRFGYERLARFAPWRSGRAVRAEMPSGILRRDWIAACAGMNGGAPPACTGMRWGRHGRGFPQPSTSWLFPHKEDVDAGAEACARAPDMTMRCERRSPHGVISATMRLVAGSTR